MFSPCKLFDNLQLNLWMDGAQILGQHCSLLRSSVNRELQRIRAEIGRLPTLFNKTQITHISLKSREKLKIFNNYLLVLNFSARLAMDTELRILLHTGEKSR